MAGEFTTIRMDGAIPSFMGASDALPVAGDQLAYQLSDVIAGRHDSYITTWATAAKNWGHPFFLRFNWEMNGRWFPWSEGVNGNKPGEYIAAWRHVHELFQRAGARNATWVWCPNIDPYRAMQPLNQVYPGDAYVDWTCLDGYNFNTPWTSFKDLYKSTYEEITGSIAPTKPMMIGETGSSETGGSKLALDHRDVPVAGHRLPQGPRAAVVQQVRRRHGLADRNQRFGDQCVRRRHRIVAVPEQQLRATQRPPAGSSSHRQLARADDPVGPALRLPPPGVRRAPRSYPRTGHQ